MKLLTHNRDKAGDFQSRVLLHVPIGFLIGFMSTFPLCLAGFTLAWLFIRYEINEDAHTKDEAWKDIFGAITGFIVGSLAGYGVLIWLVVRYCL